MRAAYAQAFSYFVVTWFNKDSSETLTHVSGRLKPPPSAPAAIIASSDSCAQKKERTGRARPFRDHLQNGQHPPNAPTFVAAAAVVANTPNASAISPNILAFIPSLSLLHGSSVRDLNVGLAVDWRVNSFVCA